MYPLLDLSHATAFQEATVPPAATRAVLAVLTPTGRSKTTPSTASVSQEVTVLFAILPPARLAQVSIGLRPLTLTVLACQVSTVLFAGKMAVCSVLIPIGRLLRTLSTANASPEIIAIHVIPRDVRNARIRALVWPQVRSTVNV